METPDPPNDTPGGLKTGGFLGSPLKKKQKSKAKIYKSFWLDPAESPPGNCSPRASRLKARKTSSRRIRRFVGPKAPKDKAKPRRAAMVSSLFWRPEVKSFRGKT